MELKKAHRKKVASDIVEYECRYNSGHFRCYLSVIKSGIKIVVVGGAEESGMPGEEFTFFRKAEGLDAAKKIAESLPPLSPEDMGRHQFEKVGYVIFD